MQPSQDRNGDNGARSLDCDAAALCVGTIAIIGLFDVMSRGRKEQFVTALLRAARRISVNLGNAILENGKRTVRDYV
jgi:hypothetical protein